MYYLIKRIFDILICITILPLFIIIIFFLYIIVKINSEGPFIHWSKRIGKNNHIFQMPKIRTMIIQTPDTASHLLKNPKNYLTSYGSFLRKTSFDELPQILSIIKGDMSLVGPRPALFNQYDLITMRKKKGIDKLVPGLTGWAQINGRDKTSLKKKVDLDFYYLKNQSFLLDLKIIFFSFIIIFKKETISH